MSKHFFMPRRTPSFLLLSCVFICACGGRTGSITPRPISVYLPVTTVKLTSDMKPVSIPIQITSTSETALVSVVGLPAGVQVAYAASDTNPSGSLTFSASSSAMTGNSMPIVVVMSAGSSASASLTIEIQ